MKIPKVVNSIELSIFKHAKSLEAHPISFGDVVKRICQGDKGLEAKTLQCHELFDSGDKQRYRKYKAQALPAVTFGCRMITRASGVAPDGRLLSKEAMKKVKDARELQEHERIKIYTYLVILDKDGVDAATVKAQLAADPNVVLVFTSPSGNGVKVVILVTAVANAAEYKQAWNACKEHYSHIAEVDKSGSDITRLCFLAHDSSLIVNESPVALDWRAYDVSDSEVSTKQNWNNTIDLSVLDYLRGNDYDDWLRVGMALHHAGIPLDIWDSWSRKFDNYETGGCAAKWSTFGKTSVPPVTFGTLVVLARENGYKPKSTSKSKQQKETKKKLKILETPFFEGRTFLPLPVANVLKDSLHFLALSNEKGLRVYQGGRYILDNCGIVAKHMRTLLSNEYKQAYYTETVAVLRDMHLHPVGIESDPCLHPEHVNVKNGILHVPTGEFKEHSPDFYSTTQLPVVYDPEATCPVIDSFLSDVLCGNEDDIQLAIEFIGYSMLMQVPLGKMLILYGPTHTGKSTFLELLKAFIGAVNCSGLSLQSLDDESLRFSRSGLVGKLINISGDLSARYLSGDSNIKKITSGDSFSVERKGVDSFIFSPYATLISACNELPTSRDKSDAWLERLIILPFLQQHRGVKAKLNYIKELTTPKELSGLLNRALAGAKHILETGVFTQTETIAKALDQYKLHNDNVSRFISECYEVVNRSKTDAIEYETTLFENYIHWCEIEGIKSVSKTAMRKALESHLRYKVKRLQIEGEKRIWAWEGLIFVGEFDASTENEGGL
ncbi:hypothetical protein F4212_12365 [Candidatus Poribacteria bacterium]|nr:hypothetical protein [Candidatus Poribacteria bacterium]